jgi:transcriptional activator of cad operon
MVSLPDSLRLASRSRLLVGDWVLDTGTQRLMRGGEAHPLDPKQLSVLLHLIEAAPGVVGYDALLERSWPGLIVGDNALHQVISHLRHQLGDDARHPRYIETLPKRGYRLLAPIETVPDPPLAAPGKPAVAHAASSSWHRNRLRTVLLLTTPLLLASAALWWHRTSTPPPPAAPLYDTLGVVSISVRPFRPATDAPDAIAEASRATEDTQRELIALRTLRLVDRVSADAGHYLLDGRIETRGDDKAITVRLTANRSGDVLWQQAFVRPAGRPGFDQAGTVALIAEAAAGTHLAVITYAHNLDPIAMHEFQTALIEWNQWVLGAGGNTHVIGDRWRHTLRRVPEFWPAQAQLVIHYANGFDRHGSLDDHRNDAYDACRRLLAMASRPERYAIPVDWQLPLATVLYRLDFDFDYALTLLYEAKARGWPAGQVDVELGAVHAARGDLAEATAHLEAALAGNAQINHRFAELLLASVQIAGGQYAQATQTASRALALMEPGTVMHRSAFRLWIQAALLYGDYHSATGALDDAWALYGASDPLELVDLLVMAGRTAQAMPLLVGLESDYGQGRAGPVGPALLAHAALGNVEQTLVWLERLVDERGWDLLPHLHHAPYLAELRADPRFAQVMQRVDGLAARGSPLRADIDALRYGLRAGR